MTVKQKAVLLRANRRLRELEKHYYSRASPAVSAVTSRLKDIYGSKNLPNLVGFYSDNLPKIKQTLLLEEARRFLKMSTSTVEGVQRAFKNRDEGIREKMANLNDEGLSAYYSIAELYSSDINTYSLASDIVYQDIAYMLLENPNKNYYIELALQVNIKMLQEGLLTTSDAANTLEWESNFIEKLLTNPQDISKIEKESSNLYKLYGDNMLDGLKQLDIDIEQRKEELEEEKKKREYYFKWH